MTMATAMLAIVVAAIRREASRVCRCSGRQGACAKHENRPSVLEHVAASCRHFSRSDQ